MNRLPAATLIVMYGAFFLIGIVMGMTGPLVPGLRSDLVLSYGQAGLVFSAQSVGSFLVLLLGGWLLIRIGVRGVLVAGVSVFSLGLACFVVVDGFATLLAANLLLGVGMSLLDIGASTLCIDAHSDNKGQGLNRLHFFFGAGAVVGPLIALALGASPGGWRWAFGVLALPTLALLPLALGLRVPGPSPEGIPQARRAYRSPFLWLGAVALFVYCGVEWGVGAWFPSYWKAIPGTEALDPAWSTSAFWFTFALGRFVVGAWADRWGFRTFLGLSLAATLAVTVLWILIPAPAAALLWVVLFGFVIAGQYPTFVALISHRFPGAAGPVTSLLSVFASLGTFVWPPAVGLWADTWGMAGLPWAQLILTGLLIAVTAVVFALEARTTADD